MLKIDRKLDELPLTKTNPKTLLSLFGQSTLKPFWVADMDFEIAQPIQKALIDRISNSGFGYEYKPNSFFEAQKKWYAKQYQINLDKEYLIFSPSITTTIALALENFTSIKNGVIIQPPVFMEFRDVIRKTKRRIVKNPLKLTDSNRYVIDFEDLEQKASIENNKVLIICNPHNPVGRVWTRNELANIVKICKENDVLLISDEIHKDIILFDNKFTSLLHFSNQWEKIIVCTSEAKTFNLCGILDSLAIIPDKNLRNIAHADFRKYNLGRTNALSRVALETAYNEGEMWLKELIKVIENNVKSIEHEIYGTKIKLIKPEGTYQVWLDFNAYFNDTKVMFQEITNKSKIGMNAGHWFGMEGALFMRMNIATENKNVVDAIRKIKTIL